jgi:hypothetical protein
LLNCNKLIKSLGGNKYTHPDHVMIYTRYISLQEWSYIPVGGTLPDTTQQHLGFGAAASMVHPATGKIHM